ncbi:MAG TPA: SusD/RagB family nutrient-binding outer membrane lipoprotein [Puia sp.]|nr:SusD/RagB family nutrient-binding outer membrane lipoprotein [Puia sp.]
MIQVQKRVLPIVLLVMIVLASSCTKNFDSLNTDPTKGSSIAPGQQLTGAAYYLDGGRAVVYANFYVLQPFVQYMSGPWGMRAGSKYIRTTYPDAVWTTFYGQSIKQLVDLIQRNKADSSLVNYIAAARILKVYIFSLLTDLYGDIPYSQAGLGYYESIYTARYDSQQSIYTDFFSELDGAVKQFDATKDAIDNDIVYNGNIDRWKKLANSLRLRLAMRLTKVDLTTAAMQARAAIAGGLMESADDNFKMIHEAYAYPDLRGNGYAQALQESDTYLYSAGTTTFINYLKQNSDPRLPCYFVNQDANGKDITSLTNYIAISPGLYWWDNWGDFIAADGTDIPQANKFATINRSFMALQSSFLHMGYAEVQLLLAEAAYRGWASNAGQYYQNGVSAAIDQLSMYPGMVAISASDKANYLAAHPLDAGKEIQEINEQKWVALFPNGYEAYANYRRTGYPVLGAITDVGLESETNGVLPRRLFYPASEAYDNATNYNAALQNLGGTDNWLKPVWWDK